MRGLKVHNRDRPVAVLVFHLVALPDMLHCWQCDAGWHGAELVKVADSAVEHKAGSRLSASTMLNFPTTVPGSQRCRAAAMSPSQRATQPLSVPPCSSSASSEGLCSAWLHVPVQELQWVLVRVFGWSLERVAVEEFRTVQGCTAVKGRLC